MLERPGTRRALIPYLLCLAALSLTASGARYAATTGAVEERLRFGNAAEQLRSEMVHRVDAYVSMLLGAAGLFAASETVEVREFRAYVERLELSRRYPGVQGVGFSRLIKSDERAKILAQRRQDIPNFHYWPDRQDGPQQAILYLEPLDQRNALALGIRYVVGAGAPGGDGPRARFGGARLNGQGHVDSRAARSPTYAGRFSDLRPRVPARHHARERRAAAADPRRFHLQSVPRHRSTLGSSGGAWAQRRRSAAAGVRRSRRRRPAALPIGRAAARTMP